MSSSVRFALYCRLLVSVFALLCSGCGSHQNNFPGPAAKNGLRTSLQSLIEAEMSGNYSKLQSVKSELVSSAPRERAELEVLGLSDGEPLVRAAALSVLAESRQSGVGPLLLKTSRDEDWRVAETSLFGLLEMYRDRALTATEAAEFSTLTNALLVKGHSRLSTVLIECATTLGGKISIDSLGSFLSRRGYWTLEGKRTAKLLANRGGATARRYLAAEMARLTAMEGELSRLMAGVER